MTQHDRSPKPGHFIVKLVSQTISNLTAAAVQALLEENQDVEKIEIQRIHRVDHQGRLELVGVSKDLFTIQDGFIFSWRDEAQAQTDYERILTTAESSPPPCEIEIEKSKIDGSPQPHTVAMTFPAACAESVGQWLSSLGFRPGEGVSGGPPAVFAYRASAREIFSQEVLAPSIGKCG